MGWSRLDIDRDLNAKNYNVRGYSHKLCPYSTAYRDKYRYIGEVCTGFVDSTPVKVVGDWVMGNSVNPDFHRAEYATYLCSDHATTSGRMVYASNPPGWRCDDPNCYYFTTVASGRCYREV